MQLLAFITGMDSFGSLNSEPPKYAHELNLYLEPSQYFEKH